MKTLYFGVLAMKEDKVMLQKTGRALMLGLMLITLLVILSPYNVSSEVQGGGITTLISLADDESQGNEGSFSSAINGDGRYLLFTSKATNLVGGDTNNTKDVFLRDRDLGTTIRISIASNSAEANLQSYAMALSADGRIAAFESDASNLVANDTNNQRDIFIRDINSGLTERVSLSASGTQLMGRMEFNDMSTDGRYVVFTSNDASVVPNDTNGSEDVFVHDRITDTTSRVSVDASGTQGNSWSSEGSISDDGRYIAFNSGASNLVPDDTNANGDVFIRDMLTGAVSRVLFNGIQLEGGTYWPRISGNGQFVVYHSWDDLVSNDRNEETDIYLYDRQNGSTELVSVGGNQAGSGYYPAISADGQTIAFLSSSSSLVACDSNRHCGISGNESCPDMFLRDRVRGQTYILSLSDLGKQAYYGVDTFYDYYSIVDSISDDGKFVVFHSSTGLTATDSNGY
jgi:Tol biopolymer transport system component